MATPAEQLATLQRIKRSGVLSLTRPDGGDVTYRSIDELDRAIADAQAAVDATAGTPRVRLVRLGFEKGTTA